MVQRWLDLAASGYGGLVAAVVLPTVLLILGMALVAGLVMTVKLLTARLVRDTRPLVRR